jgi:hypothetical protein
MTDAEGIVLTLCSTGKCGQTPGLTYVEHFFPSPRQNFVGIGLVSHIPDQFVRGGIEYVVDSDGEFDDSEAGAEVAAGLTDAIEQKQAQLLGQFGELSHLQLPEIRRIGYLIQQRRLWSVRWYFVEHCGYSTPGSPSSSYFWALRGQ